MVVAQDLLGKVSSSSTSVTSSITSSTILVSDVPNNILWDQLEQLANSSDTKENDQTDANSLNNSPSSTSSSKKLNMSPIAIPLPMTTAQKIMPTLNSVCEAHDPVFNDVPDDPSRDFAQGPDLVAISVPSSSNTCDVATSTSALVDTDAVSSTTDVDMKCVSDSPILEKTLRKKKRKQNGVREGIKHINGASELVYNGRYEVVDMNHVGSACDRETIQPEQSQYDQLSNPIDLKDNSVDVNTETAECQQQDTVKEESPKRKFPDSFEELILMHFHQELNVAEMVESMNCLDKENKANEIQLAALVKQMNLLTNQTRQLENLMK